MIYCNEVPLIHKLLDDDETKKSMIGETKTSKSKIEHEITKKEQQIIDYTKNFFIRVYPKGTRMDSSNYDPFPGLFAGA